MSEAENGEVVRALLASLRSLELGRSGIVARLVEKPRPGAHEEREKVSVVEGVGLRGDHARKAFWKGALVPGREITAISFEVAAVLGFDPLTTGDNIVTADFDLRGLEAGDRVAVGDEVILIRSANNHRPCDLFRERTSRVAYDIALEYNYRGALFTVARGGVIRKDDVIAVERA